MPKDAAHDWDSDDSTWSSENEAPSAKDNNDHQQEVGDASNEKRYELEGEDKEWEDVDDDKADSDWEDVEDVGGNEDKLSRGDHRNTEDAEGEEMNAEKENKRSDEWREEDAFCETWGVARSEGEAWRPKDIHD